MTTGGGSSPRSWMRVPRVIGRAAVVLTRLLSRRTRSRRRVLSDHDGRLRPGRYVVTGDRLWHLRGVAIPDHLARTKGRLPPGRPTPSSGAPWTRRSLRRLLWSWAQHLMLVSPPWGFTLSRRDTDGTYTIAVAAFDGGLVLVDPDAARVARWYGGGPITDAYVDLRRRFAQHVATPAFEVDVDRRWLHEPLLVGRHFLDLDDADRVHVVERLLADYASLAEAEATGSSADVVSEALATAERAQLPAEFQERLAEIDLLELAAAWPLAPSHVAVIPKNVMIVDGAGVLIDVASLRWAPFFYDVVNLVAKARGAVLAHFETGGFDPGIARLFDAAGLAYTDPPTARQAMLLTYCLLGAQRQATVEGEVQLAKFEHNLARRWREVRTDRRARIR